MEDLYLSPELLDLENRLAQRTQAAPSESLRGRVQAAVRLELRRPSFSSEPWRRVAAAAAVLLWLNLSMSLANNTDWLHAPRPDRADIVAVADQVRTLLPELPEREVHRRALLESGARLVPLPNLEVSLNEIQSRGR